MTHVSVLFAQFSGAELLAHPAVQVLGGLAALVVLGLIAFWLSTTYIPNNYVGVVEKLWSKSGSVTEGSIIALEGEAGYQADLLRGGLHFGLWRWQFRIHKVRLVTIPQGKIGYVYARDGEPLQGNVIDSTGALELVIFLQDHFAITVEDEEVIPENLDSVDNVVAYVARKLGSKT